MGFLSLFSLPSCVQLHLQQTIMDKGRYYKRRFKNITDGFLPNQIADAQSNAEIASIVDELLNSSEQPEKIQFMIKRNRVEKRETENEQIRMSPFVVGTVETFDEEKESEKILESEWMKEEMDRILSVVDGKVSVK